VIEKFVEENKWIDFLVKDPKIRSTTSVCLSLDLNKDQVSASACYLRITMFSLCKCCFRREEAWWFMTVILLLLLLLLLQVKKMVALLEKEHVAYDIGSYRDAPPGLRYVD